MAEKSTTDSKLKQVVCDDSSDDDKGTGNNDLGLISFDKLSLGPKKKLLVLCFGGLLVDWVHVRNRAVVRHLQPDVESGNFLVFKRPFCTEFLNFCFERFEVAFWSSAKERNIDPVLSNISGGNSSKFLFVWGQDECTDSDYHCLSKKRKPLFLKELKNIWDKKEFKGKYSATNTLLIDDEPHTALLNPPHTGIFPDSNKTRNKHDTFLERNGEFRKYLNGLVDAKDVPSYVKDHPFGQPAITPSHPDWDFYGNIVRSLDNRSDESGTYYYSSD